MEILLKVLDMDGIAYEYTGPEDQEIYGIQNQNGCYPYFCEMLYFQSSLSHPLPPRNICVISGNIGLYEEIQKILFNYIKKESLLIQMQDRLNAYRSSETDMISEVMDNPSIILRENGEPLVWKGFKPEEDLGWVLKINFKEIRQSRHGLKTYFQDKSEEVPYTLMIVPYTNSRGKKRYCVLVENEKKLNRVIDPIFIEKICNILQCYTFTNQGIVQPVSRLEELLKGMLYTVPPQPAMMKNELKKAGWVDQEKYYVLLIDISLGKVNTDDVGMLSQKLNAKIFSHRNYYVCILRGNYKEEYDSRTDFGIDDFLMERNFYAGLSYGFFDIINLSVAYKQAEEAIKVMLDVLKDRHFYAFAESVVTYLIKTSAKCGELTIDSLCHPDVYRIYEYDKRYGSDYIHFLRIYIYSGGSVKRTSEALFVHKNTVYQKIEKLKEFFYLDLSDLYVFIKIYVSLVVLDQIEGENTSEFLRWM